MSGTNALGSTGDSTSADATRNGGGIKRRSVIQAAAWSVPVVAVAVATPLASASVAADYTLAVTQFDVAPAGEVNPVLAPNQPFNTLGTITNLGPDAAPGLRAQVTFPSAAVPNEFAVSAGWVISSVTEVTIGGIARWHVELTYAATVQPNEAVNFTIATRTRVEGAFVEGESGPYNCVGRVYGADGPVESELTDSFNVMRV